MKANISPRGVTVALDVVTTCPFLVPAVASVAAGNFSFFFFF